ncbi:S66 peptidase family protein [Candidatus Merdisoma sp. JLR.KK011]|uniref:S66 family peptidase n=1 Tax=Candidatus Merdisoma sp. JLR.KK011 TaxID=3114299 RepID=UPI002FF3ADBD
MKKASKTALISCSNAQPRANSEKLTVLKTTLSSLGLLPVFGDCIYEKESVFSGTAKERAESLMSFYRDPEIRAIFDISGGDIANEILPYLDYDVIAKSNAVFWGYSDLTTVINAIFTKTGKQSVLYQVRNLISLHAQEQRANFSASFLEGKPDLFSFHYEMIQKDSMEGTVVGGNIRCLLKLAGTPYWPDMNGKILLLESLGGLVPQMTAHLNQLKQMGVFEQINGILLGTFTKMEEEKAYPSMPELVKRYAGKELPIAKTNEIGHNTNAKAIVIGQKMNFTKFS